MKGRNNMDKNVLSTNFDMDVAIAYLKKKRKELGLTQDEFGKLFDLPDGCYRKYETEQRGLSVVVFRMMKIIIAEYEKSKLNVDMNSILSSDYLETLREECTCSIFTKEQSSIVNLIFDYIIRNVKTTEYGMMKK